MKLIRLSLSNGKRIARLLKTNCDPNATSRRPYSTPAGNIVVVVDLQGTIVRFNRACETVSGYTAKDAVGQNMMALLVAADELNAVHAAFAKLCAGEFPLSFESYCVTKNGGRRLVSWSYTVLLDANGAVEYFIGTGIDITEQKRSQLALESSEALYRTLTSNFPDGAVLLMDKELRIVLADGEGLTQTGHTSEGVRGRHIWDVAVDNSDRPNDLLQLFRDAIAGKPGKIDHKVRNAWRTVKVVPVFGESNEVTHVLSVSQDITVRKKTEDALRSERDLTEAILDTVGNLVLVVDLEGTIVRFNRACVTVIGYSEDEAIGKNAIELFIPPDELEAVQIVFAQLCAGNYPLSFDFHCVTKDGGRRLISWSDTVLHDAEGKVQYVVGTGIDITDRKETEAALHESEERFRQLAENSHEVFWMSDPATTKMLYVSPAYETVWGRTRQSLYDLPGSFMEAIHPDDRDRMAEGIRDKVFTGTLDQEYRIVRPDGEIRWIWDRGYPIRNEAGEAFRIAGTALDITDRKHVAEALRKSEERFRQMAESIGEVFWMASPDFQKVEYVSPGYEAVWGRTCESLYANPSGWLDVIVPEDKARAMADMEQLATAATYKSEYRILRPDGSICWIEDRGYKVFDENGVHCFIAGVATDITERKNADNELRENREVLQQGNDWLEQRVVERTRELASANEEGELARNAAEAARC